ncbi:leucyl aminopeptidase [Lachnospiraceae bacterium WCA-693-APC-MOT-I]|uniref:Leucyl aminopeptidase n=2 Tax=Velocimicrobium porci TaxID=2606634 RepID=A0A6L5XXV6_9FIRM|nr:leucyl aminopeptidase [Velocimicrobium porci]
MEERYKMSFLEQIKEENKLFIERYELTCERIQDLINEKIPLKEAYRDYFYKTAKFLGKIQKVTSLVENGELRVLPIEQLQCLNHELYEDIIGENYEQSYANPSYAVDRLGEGIGQMLSFLYTELRGCIAYAFENRLFEITIGQELFLEIYHLFEEEEEKEILEKSIKSSIVYYAGDYSEDMVKIRTREMLNPSYSYATDIIMNCDLTDLRYLYYFGEYITENEWKTATYLNSFSQKEIDKMASTYTEGFRTGFIANNLDISIKSIVNIRYCVGFERLVKAAINQFLDMGLKPTIYRAAVSSIQKNQNLKIGYYSTSPNRQYDYDHRFDDALYISKSFLDRKLDGNKSAYEEMKEQASCFAGPAVIEVFGETPFAPVQKKEALRLSEKQQKLVVDYKRDASLLSNQYLKGDEYSFTIIAYPIPEIGADFEQIFHETVKVNTLDMKLYETIQEKIIDVLDQGEYVHVVGKGKNKTDIKVMLRELKDAKKETLFENCLADVNIPVGEVFTSPQLKGTEGTLHVSEVYLRDLKYIDLELHFKDGMISSYTCNNFEEEEENKKFIRENLMQQHESLPIGEFAIGTNTTAYVMGKNYGISHMLPILIAEKTGPHFAVGDTCYKMSEDIKTYNPNGKEIVAKDNEVSIKRKTSIEEAYFNCHTDITIPYNELGTITVHTRDGKAIDIILDGKFVLEGTEELNGAFEQLKH